MSGTFGVGFKLLKRLCEEQSTLHWYKAKLIPEMFRPGEQEVLAWVQQHVTKHHALPQPETLFSMFNDVQQFPTPEPGSYYLEHVENRMYYELINQANIDSQKILKESAGDHQKAMKCMKDALAFIATHKFRQRIVDLAKEGPKMVMDAYHNVLESSMAGTFGWPHMDDAGGGMMPGDVISFVGLPATGKTFMLLRVALHNWEKGHRPLVVSMEMSPLPLVQRIAAMYAHTNISQLKVGGYSSQTYQKFQSSLFQMAGGPSGFYVVDGNLAASVDDIYTLAQQLKCDQVYIDGAYLLKHPNARLDRYTKVAENTELIKQRTTDLELPSICSYQFAKTAKKTNKGGGGKGNTTTSASDEVTLEDIGNSITIGQISSIVLGLFQEESVETLEKRRIRVMKGRGGEVGSFDIHWDFATMKFGQYGVDETATEAHEQLQYL